jgi:hypothetical protein
MLVDHDVEPAGIDIGKLVEVAIEQVVTDPRIEVLVGQDDAQRATLQAFLPGRMVGHLGEVPNAHADLPCHRAARQDLSIG